MKNWLKFFGLGFFSDNTAKQAARRGIGNFFLGFVLALVFIFCGVLAANTLPFGTHYKKAAEFKSFVREAFGENNLTVKDGQAAFNGVVNDVPEQGYKLVIDTRPSTAYDKFVPYCELKDGSGEISYEDYRALSDGEKSKYNFKIRYTPEELVLTDELCAEHEKVLAASGDKDISAQYAKLLNNKGGYSAQQYREEAYKLYLRAYCPELYKTYKISAPLLRNYYYVNYLYKADFTKYLFVFDDSLIASFRTENGLDISFYGVFEKLRDTTVTANNADAFIKDAFDAALSMQANVYAMNTFRFAVVIALMPIILAFVMWLVLRYLKTDIKYRTLTGCIKIQGAFLWFTGLLTALIVFVCGFFVSASVLNFLPLIVFFAALAARTLVYLVLEKIRKCKSQETPDEEEQQL